MWIVLSTIKLSCSCKKRVRTTLTVWRIVRSSRAWQSNRDVTPPALISPHSCKPNGNVLRMSSYRGAVKRKIGYEGRATCIEEVSAIVGPNQPNNLKLRFNYEPSGFIFHSDLIPAYTFLCYKLPEYNCQWVVVLIYIIS